MDFESEIEKSIAKALQELGLGSQEVNKLEHPALRRAAPFGLRTQDRRLAQGKLDHGDYSSNAAMAAFSKSKIKSPPAGRAGQKSKLQGKIEKWREPFELARDLVAILNTSYLIPGTCSRIEAASPGFVNFWLSKEALLGELQNALRAGENYGKPPSAEAPGDTMLVDFSHPNIAKRFGVGHLRSTIIGWAIINLYRFLGWHVIADNFLGDWGTQFGMIITQIQKSRSGIRSLKKLNIDELERLYVEFNQKAKKDPKLLEEARMWFKKLEDGDAGAREVWQVVREVSLQEFKRIWDLLGVEFDYVHGESFFEDKIEAVIEDAQRMGIASWDQGALIVPLEGFEAPLMLLKSDGATTYEARDLAAVRFWAKEFSPDFIVYEVGVDQDLHFRQLFKVAEMLGYAKKGQLVHVKHGLYRLPTGKMRTRAGQTVKLELVLDEAVERAKRLGEKEKSPEANLAKGGGKGDDGVAKAVGIGAVKYFDLSHHPSSDIIFDWEKMFALEGNSAPYLQYTHARCRSVLTKANGRERMVNSNRLLAIGHKLFAEEEALLRYFYRFPEAVKEAASGFSPNTLCNFLFELAQRYNTFYNRHRILGASRKGKKLLPNYLVRSAFRLALTQVTADILKTGLGLLGITAPERM